jgi:hypothetical protein
MISADPTSREAARDGGHDAAMPLLSLSLNRGANGIR